MFSSKYYSLLIRKKKGAAYVPGAVTVKSDLLDIIYIDQMCNYPFLTFPFVISRLCSIDNQNVCYTKKVICAHHVCMMIC